MGLEALQEFRHLGRTGLRLPGLGRLEVGLLGLLGLEVRVVGPAVVGLQFFMNQDNSAGDVAGAEAFFGETTTTAYDDTACAGVAPTPMPDYTRTETARNINPLAALPAAVSSAPSVGSPTIL